LRVVPLGATEGVGEVAAERAEAAPAAVRLGRPGGAVAAVAAGRGVHAPRGFLAWGERLAEGFVLALHPGGGRAREEGRPEDSTAAVPAPLHSLRTREEPGTPDESQGEATRRGAILLVRPARPHRPP